MIDELFQKAPDRFLDPRLQFWDERLSRSSTTAKLEVDWPSIVLGETSPEMTIRFFENDHPIPVEPISWDDDLNDVLISRAVRAVDEAQEATRFSLALRAAFRRAGRDFGDGYFNSVFFAVLKESGLAEHPLLSPLVQDLDYMHNIESREPSERYQRCHGMIKSAIQAKANELTKNLGYSLAEAKAILVAALVHYIDRRFSVSIRRERGLL